MANIRTLLIASLGFLLVAATLTSGSSWAEAKRLALKGYDPVAYFTMGWPVQGKPEFQDTLDEVRYYFATAEHLEMFRKDPDRYAPQYRGICAMGLGAKGYKVEANPENWLIHEGRLYVTQRDFGPPGFKRDPKRWVTSANSHVKTLQHLPIGSAISWW